MTLESAIIEKVRRLPAAQQEEVLRFADGLDHAFQKQASPYRAQEIAWLESNRTAYAGRWVALHDGTLVVDGCDAPQVYCAAKAKGVETPLVVHVSDEDQLPFVAGW